MVKQAKALREQRRAVLDFRHKYLIGRLAGAGTLGELEVEDALISDDLVAADTSPPSAGRHSGVHLYIDCN